MVNFRLDGKKALVTGANKGLGQAIARTLAELGATVYGTSRSDTGAKQIEADLGTRGLLLDLEKAESFPAFVAEVQNTADGPIDILINNAGVNAPAPALELTEQQWDSVVDTNLKGTFFLTREFAKQWVASGIEASVVNIGSQAGTVGIEERAAYCATKGGVQQLAKVLAIEWAPHGIRVNTVAPTFVRTDLTASTLDRPGWGQTLLSRIPMGRFGEVDDIVGATAFLAGDAARFVTGHALLVDGGYTAW